MISIMGLNMSMPTSDSRGGIILACVIVLAALTTTSAFVAPRRQTDRSLLIPSGDATSKSDISQVDLKPDAEAAGFSLQNAYFLATLSKIAYETKAEAQKIIQGKKKDGGLEYDHFHWFEPDPSVSNDRKVSDRSEDTEAFVAADDDVIVVVFRGSSEGSDWATNFDAIPAPTPAGWMVENGAIHEGFNNGVATVWEAHGMIATIRTLYNEPGKKRKLFLAGHSLGGALATVAAARLVFEEDVHVAGMYTIGSPRVFNSAMAKCFDEKVNGGKPMKSKYFRARNNNDIVTRAPPYPIFEHVGTEVYFDRYGVINMTNPADRVLGRLDALTRLEFTDGINDHAKDAYVKLFRRALINSRLSVLSKTTRIVANGLEKGFEPVVARGWLNGNVGLTPLVLLLLCSENLGVSGRFDNDQDSRPLAVEHTDDTKTFQAWVGCDGRSD